MQKQSTLLQLTFLVNWKIKKLNEDSEGNSLLPQFSHILVIFLEKQKYRVKYNCSLLINRSVQNNSLQAENSRVHSSILLLLHHSSALNVGDCFFLQTLLPLRHPSESFNIFHSVFSPIDQDTTFITPLLFPQSPKIHISAILFCTHTQTPHDCPRHHSRHDTPDIQTSEVCSAKWLKA